MFNIPQSMQSFKCFLPAAASGATGSACRPASDPCLGTGGNRCQGLSMPDGFLTEGAGFRVHEL